MDTLKAIIEKIKESKKIIISTHLSPDGDGIGAGIALLLAIKQFNVNVRFIIEDDIPENLKFLIKDKEVERLEKFEITDEDLFILLDTGSIDRMGLLGKKNIKIPMINIDHHVSNIGYGDYNYIDTSSGSASEIIFDLLELLNVKWSKEIARAIYTGIVNDTGNFKHSNVTEKTFLKAAFLIKEGANNNEVINKFYDNKTYAGIKLLGCGLEKAIYVSEKKVIYSIILQKDFIKYFGNKNDTDSVVENLLKYSEANVAIFIREEKNGNYKGSMRTKSEEIDLNKIASIFAGGGHKKAAGFSTNLAPEKIIKKIIENI